ncbi:MAG TPA: DHA2 family efflux MFS transporter permease subunit [Rhabdochlamydiaceae bacterium]|jgi:DHA2 family multidrug resistance protein
MTPLSRVPLLLLTIALSLGTFMFVLDYSIANVSIPYIAGDLAVSNDQGTYVITSFAVGNAIALPMTGWLTKRIGAVRLMLISLFLFVFFSWLCGASYDFNMLIVSRFLQGFCSGPMVPLSQSLLLMNYPEEKKTTAMALWSTIVIAAPVVGPMLGGWISFDYEWPWIFYINIPVGLFSLIMIWFILKNRDTPLSKESLDIWGLIFLAGGVTGLQVLLDKGEQFDWFRSPWMRFFGILSVVSFTLLIVWSLTRAKPLIELKLLRIRTFGISILYIGVAYGIYFGSVVLVPLWLQTNMGYNSIWAGIAVAPIGIAPLLFSPWIGKLVTRFGPIPLLFISFMLFAFSCFYTAFFDTDVNLSIIELSRLFLGCGLYFFITPLFTLSMLDIEQEKLPSAAGIFHFVRAMVGGVGTSVFTTMWIRRTAYHHQIVGENLTPFSFQTDTFLSQLSQLGLHGKKALEQMNQILNDQAAMLAINDCFWVMGWTFIALIFFLPLGFKKKAIVPSISSH